MQFAQLSANESGSVFGTGYLLTAIEEVKGYAVLVDPEQNVFIYFNGTKGLDWYSIEDTVRWIESRSATEKEPGVNVLPFKSKDS